LEKIKLIFKAARHQHPAAFVACLCGVEKYTPLRNAEKESKETPFYFQQSG